MASKTRSIEVLKADGIKFPAQCRPFKTAQEFCELDEVMTRAVHDEYELDIVIPKGTSRRKAIMILHRRQICFH
jgi:hypothetical protein